MRVAVFGANGRIGRQVVTQLLATGNEVTAITRGASDPGRHARLRVAIANLDDPETIARLLQGQEAVLSGIGPRSLRDGPVASSATTAIIAAMHIAGVRRLVAVSAAPVGDMPPDEGLFGRLILYPLARTILRPVFSDLAVMEKAMWASGLDVTAVRPPRLTDGPLTRRYRRRTGGSVPHGVLISRADVADAMIGAVDDPATFGQPVGVAN
jgi:uncharacterized protein YbjT (DUF2867 family)